MILWVVVRSIFIIIFLYFYIFIFLYFYISIFLSFYISIFFNCSCVIIFILSLMSVVMLNLLKGSTGEDIHWICRIINSYFSEMIFLSILKILIFWSELNWRKQFDSWINWRGSWGRGDSKLVLLNWHHWKLDLL